MRLIPPLLFLSVSVAFAACSSSDEDAFDTPSSFCEKWAAAACNDEVISICQAADANDCQASQIEFCLDQLPATGFAGTGASQCVDAVREAYEDADISSDEIAVVLRFAEPCDQLIRGQRAQGETCASRRDCDAPEGFDCIFKSGSSSGTCQLPESVGPGADCSAANAVCGTGFYCNGENCIAGESAGDACSSNDQCGTTGFCGTSGVCEARLAVGADCAFDEQCGTGVCYSFSDSDQVCTDRLRLSRTEPICETLR